MIALYLQSGVGSRLRPDVSSVGPTSLVRVATRLRPPQPIQANLHKPEESFRQLLLLVRESNAES